MIQRKKSNAVVGLDIEAGSIAATELRSNAGVSNGAVAALPPGVFRDGEVLDGGALSSALKDLFARNKLSKDVRLGIANQRVVVRTFRLPVIEKRDELETAVRFQAQDHIPMPLDQAVLDWQVVGHTVSGGGEARMDVIVVAARREMISPLLVALRDAGLRPEGIDLSAFGMIRALARELPDAGGSQQQSYEARMAADADGVAPAGTSPATLFCNLGDVTNLAVARGSTCLFTRISPFGIEGIAQRLAERRGLTLEHARQWLVHVGLEEPLDGVEGDPETVEAARDALAEGVAKLVDELRLSLEYYGAQEDAVAVERVVACGPGTTVPGLTARLEREFGHSFATALPPALSYLDDATAARLTLSYGLALEE